MNLKFNQVPVNNQEQPASPEVIKIVKEIQDFIDDNGDSFKELKRIYMPLLPEEYLGDEVKKELAKLGYKLEVTEDPDDKDKQKILITTL